MPDLTNAHARFFEQLKVNPVTGRVSEKYLKFASYPHVGSCYGEMRCVLIVGMDIAEDTTKGRIHSYEQRRSNIEDKHPGEHNPHMSGTYVTAMHFLRNECREWRDWLDWADPNRVPQGLLSNTEKTPAAKPATVRSVHERLQVLA